MKEIEKARMGIITVLAVMLVSIKGRLPRTRRFSSGITTLALAGIVLLVAAGSASAVNVITSCGNVGAGDYVLGANLGCAADQTCLVVTADNVTIDGYNATDDTYYTITGSVTTSNCKLGLTGGCGEAMPSRHSAVGIAGTDAWNLRENVTLKNLTISEFCTGIGIVHAKNITVTRCKISDSGLDYGHTSASSTQGIHLSGTRYCDITKNEIYGTNGSICGCGAGGNGIFSFGGDSEDWQGDDNSITCNNLHDNAKAGFHTKKACANNIIRYNNVTGNGVGGIVLRCMATDDNMVEYNYVADNSGTGIYVRGSRNTLRYNTVINNKNDCQWLTECSGKPAAAVGKNGVGIRVQADAGAGNTIYNNSICNNEFLDIEDNSATKLAGDYNDCDNCNGYAGDDGFGANTCRYTCGSINVYFDYDMDGYYSDDPVNCQCNIAGGAKCACCNPGYFNTTHADVLKDDGIVRLSGELHDDPNDCDNSIGGSADPDLVIQDLAVAYLDGGANETHYKVSYKVCNIGGGPSVGSVARTTIDGTTQYDQNIGILVASECSGVITVEPLAMSPDSDYIEVCADATNTNPNEINENNNCSDTTLGARKPDLIITAKYETWEVKPNYWINYTVCNIGNATAPASTTRVNIDGSNYGPSGSVPQLAPGACTGDIRIPNTRAMSADGIDNITLFADGNNSGNGVIEEWNETNNSKSNVWKLTLDAEIGVDQPEFVDPQSQFTINITVNPMLNDISAVQYDLYYNTSVVWAEWANPGSFLKQGGATTDVTVLSIDNLWDVAGHKGKISYAETTYESGTGSLPSVNTEGILTTIHFSAIGVRGAYSVMNLDDSKMSDSLKNDVPVNITDCGVTIYDNIPPVANASSKYWVSNVASKFQCFAALCCCNSHGGWENASEWKGNEITYVRWDFGDGQYGTSEGLEDCQKHHEYTTWKWISVPSHPNKGYYENFTAYLTVRDDGVPQLSNTTEVEVVVYIAGDTNGDGVVDIFDAACVGKHWGQKADNNPPDPCCTRYWTELQPDEADLNNDNDVDTIDAMIVGTNWNHLAYPPYYQD